MSKVICDICGTSYPSTAEQCPICGTAREAVEEKNSDEIIPIEVPRKVSESHSKGGRFAASNVRKRNQGSIKYTPVPEEEELDLDENFEDEDDDEYESFEEEAEEKQANPVLVVLLILVIAALLAATGYIFVRYFMPNVLDKQEPTASTQATTTEPSTEATTETTGIPCTSLVLTSGSTVELNKEGANWLLNVITLPENTTDQLTYASADETVATVSEGGRITAVGEGETVISIYCGEKKLECTVICTFTETEDTQSTEATEGTEPDEDENTEATEETTEPTEETKPLLDVKLKLNFTDLTLSFAGDSYKFKINPELTPEDVTWTSEDPEIATVENGVVTAVKRGTTNIFAEYGDQKVTCIIRCNFR